MAKSTVSDDNRNQRIGQPWLYTNRHHTHPRALAAFNTTSLSYPAISALQDAPMPSSAVKNTAPRDPYAAVEPMLHQPLGQSRMPVASLSHYPGEILGTFVRLVRREPIDWENSQRIARVFATHTYHSDLILHPACRLPYCGLHPLAVSRGLLNDYTSEIRYLHLTVTSGFGVKHSKGLQDIIEELERYPKIERVIVKLPWTCVPSHINVVKILLLKMRLARWARCKGIKMRMR